MIEQRTSASNGTGSTHHCNQCSGAIRWVKLGPKFRSHPVDFEPSAQHGSIHIDDRNRATILPKEVLEKARAQGVPLYVSHFATCPDAGRFRTPGRPVPQPATPIRTLVLKPEQAARVLPPAEPLQAAAVSPHSQIGQQLERELRAREQAPAPAEPCAPCAEALTITPADLQRLKQLEEKERALRRLLDECKTELEACKAAEQQLGGEWLRELRELRSEYEAADPLPASRTAVAALRELALRMGYRLR